MKRLTLVFGSFVLWSQLSGCGGSEGGGGGGRGDMNAPTVKPSEDPSLPAEVREEAQREEAHAKKVMDRLGKKP